jgi:dihydroxyacid dehydratase/phosphogluconate dehydratase
MFIKTLIPMACLTAVLGFSAPAAAQVTDALKHAGQVTVDTGKKAVTATEQAGKKVGTETKKAVTGAPKGATGVCKDGTYTKATTHSGACSKHGGVKRWF